MVTRSSRIDKSRGVDYFVLLCFQSLFTSLYNCDVHQPDNQYPWRTYYQYHSRPRSKVKLTSFHIEWNIFKIKVLEKKQSIEIVSLLNGRMNRWINGNDHQYLYRRYANQFLKYFFYLKPTKIRARHTWSTERCLKKQTHPGYVADVDADVGPEHGHGDASSSASSASSASSSGSAVAAVDDDDGPVFDTGINQNVTVQIGRTAHLHCRVRSLRNRTVRSLIRTAINQWPIVFFFFIEWESFTKWFYPYPAIALSQW